MKKLLSLLLAMLLMVSLLPMSAFAEGSDEDVCTLTIEDNKYFDISGAGEYDPGETVTISATPKHAGVVFEEWHEYREEGGAAFSYDAACSFNIDRDITLEILDEPAYTAFIRPGEGVENQIVTNSRKANTTDRGVMFFTADDEGKLQFHFPASDYFKAPAGKKFDCWELDGKNYAPGDVLTLIESDGDHTSSINTITVMAKWKDDRTYTLTIEDNEYFDISGAGEYDPSETVTISAIPKHAGVVFEEWHEYREEGGATFSYDAACSFNIGRDITLEILDEPAYTAFIRPGEGVENQIVTNSRKANTTDRGVMFFTADDEGKLQFHFPASDYFKAPEEKKFDCWELDGQNYAPGDVLTLIESDGDHTTSSNTITVMAKWEDPYDVWVNGEQLTDDNPTIDCGSGTATYDPTTQTLTLDGAQITQTHEGSGFGGAIYAMQDLTVNIIGDSSISLGEYTNGDGIYTTGNLTITGDKTLNITIKNEDGYSDAVWVNSGNLTVDMEGNLTVNSTGTGLSATGDIMISGDGSKTISADAKGIYSSGADIALSGSGDVTIDAGYGIYAQTGKAELAGSGSVSITSAINGTYSAGDMILSGSGEVDIYGEADGVELGGTDSKVLLNGSGSPITLKAGADNKAVFNVDTEESPVAGTNFDKYTAAGEPDTNSVVYVPTTYDVWVNGEQFTSYKLTINCGEGTATYDPDTATLTLNGAQITQENKSSTCGAIYTENSLTVNVIGNSSVTLSEDTNGYGIYSGGALALTGDAAFNITTANAKTSAILAKGDLTVDMNGNLMVDTAGVGLSSDGNIIICGDGNKTVKAGADANGIYAEKDLKISGKGNVKVNARWYGMFSHYGDATVSIGGDIEITAGVGVSAFDGSVKISSKGNVAINSDFNSIYVPGNGDVTISCEGDVSFTSDADSGIYATSGNVTISNDGNLTITAAANSGNGIYAGKGLTISGNGNADIKANYYGIYSGSNVEISRSGDMTITAKVEGIFVLTGNASLSGDGDVTICSDYVGAYTANGSLILSGNGEVDIYGEENSVKLGGTDSRVLLNGNGSPITLKAGDGKTAVYNVDTKERPVAGTNFDDYKCVTGAPDTASVVYRPEHSFTNYVSDGNVTCTADGTKTAVCDNGCGTSDTKPDVGTAKGHTYGDPTYQWNDDKCTATRTCTACAESTDGHTDTETVTGTYVKDTNATCTIAESGHYEVKFTNTAFVAQQTTADSAINGNPLGHDFTGEYKDNGDGTHSRKCARCDEYGATENHSYKDYVCVCGAEDLTGAKETAKEAIIAEQGDDTSEAVAKAVEDAIAAIDAATTVDEVNAAMEDGIAAIRAAKAGNVPPAPVTYTIIDGANSTWTKGSNSGILVRSDAPFAKFVGVKVDGKAIAATNYTAEEGSTIVTLTPAYLETLEVGIHSLEIVSNDGSASTNFTVKADSQSADSDDPQTGDGSMIYLWTLILVVSAAALSATAIYSRKRKHS